MMGIDVIYGFGFVTCPRASYEFIYSWKWDSDSYMTLIENLDLRKHWAFKEK